MQAHQRFVNTTPNPRATKNNKGDDEVWPLFPPPPFDGVSVDEGGVNDVGAIEAVEVGGSVLAVVVVVDVSEERVLETACLTNICAPSTTSGLMKAIVGNWGLAVDGLKITFTAVRRPLGLLLATRPPSL